MNKQLKDSFRNSTLGRAQTTPKKRFHSFINNSFKRHRSDTGMVEDRIGSVTIVRTIVGLLVIHLVFIGGVLVRGHLAKSGSGIAIDPSITPPPAVTATETAPTATASTTAPTAAPIDLTKTNTATPLPTLTVAPTAAQTAAQTKPVTPTVPAADTKPQQNTVKPVVASTSITQAPADDVAEEVTPAQPTVVEVKPAQNVRTVMKKHRVASGDTWSRIATQNGISVEALKSANPKAASKNTLFSGIILDVPIPADSAEGKTIAATQEQEAVIAKGKTHVVKSGESLGKIAKKYKTTVAKIRDLNNLTPADDKKIRPGMELKVAE